MASSSVSQEDFDPEYELATRRSRVRVARSTRGTVTATNRQLELGLTGSCPDCEHDSYYGSGGGVVGGGGSATIVSESGGGGSLGGGLCGGVAAALEHDTSPKPTSRVKDKRSRPNHINKGKQQRDRRKLREKRRSTGVVHLPSTESTGGSTGEDDDGLLSLSMETKKNTMLNECVDKDKNANHSNEDRMPRVFHRRNKSPSDLDADDEDNQDYDSAVNQSDSTMSLKQELATVSSSNSSGGQGRCRATSNGRPDTPDTESLEDLLERAREENRNLLELLAEKDHKISSLQDEVNRLQRVLQSSDLENDKLKEENKTLLRAMSQLRVA